MSLEVQVEFAYSATVPAGNVISQRYEPPPNADGAIPVDGVVILTVSLGSGQASVPAIVGLGIVAARAAIVAAGLVDGVVTYFVDPVHAYVITAQNPAAGSLVTPASGVDYTVNVNGTVAFGSHLGSARRH